MKKVISLDNIKFASLNKKYYGNFRLTKEYREFKNLLMLSCKKGLIRSPYEMIIEVSMYNDYDNILKPIGDALQSAGIIMNDKDILAVYIIKHPLKRGTLGKLEVQVGHYENK
jgi:Holliday junction resolvase RusA-like endonuclease